MLSLFAPGLWVDSVFDIDLDGLLRRGIRGLVFDLDNTIVRWGTAEVTEELKALFVRALSLGFRACILSNNFSGRSQRIADELGVKAIGNAMKPSRRGFLRALRLMELRPAEVAVVGDQLVTDILGGNRSGMFTILVNPLWKKELAYTRFVRRIEKAILRRLKAAGRLNDAL